MSTPPVDQAARDRALDPFESFIVQAPAGSGKTELLTRRILSLLAVVEHPEEILAITFTRKAAAEMVERVLESLRKARDAQAMPTRDYEKQGHELALKVLERDAELNWQLLNDPRRLRISTIDALNLELARQLPLLSTLGGPVQPNERNERLFKRLGRDLLLRDTDQYQRVLNICGNDFGRASQLISRMLATRDQWARHVLLAGPGEALRQALEDTLKRMIEQRMAMLREMLESLDLQEGIRWLPWLSVVSAGVRLDTKREGSPLYDGKSPLTQDTIATLKAGIEAFGIDADLENRVWTELRPEDVCWPEAEVGRLPAFRMMAETLLSASESDGRRDYYKKVSIRQGFPTSAFAEELGYGDDLKCVRETVMSLLTTAGHEGDSAGIVLEAWSDISELPEPRYTDEQWALLEELFLLLQNALPELHERFRREGRVDFIEVGRRAIVALGTEQQPTDLALHLDYRLQHILVDEFQDTSISQFTLFSRLVAGWDTAGSRSFFIVGDPMQSIYRFREADVELFDYARQNGIGPVRLTPLQLQANFRSSPDVVRWVNDTFQALMHPPGGSLRPGGVDYVPATATHEFSGVVSPVIDINLTQDQMADRVAAQVQRSLETLPPDGQAQRRTIAILLRSRTHATPIAAALERLNIQNLSVDMEKLGDRLVVRDLRSLQRVLCYPHDHLHWAAVLRAPWCGLTLNDLHALFHAPEDARCFDERLHDPEVLATLSADGRKRVERLMEILQPALHGVQSGAVVPWIESSWLQLGGAAVAQRESDRLAVLRAIDTLADLEREGLLFEPDTVDETFDKLYAHAPEDSEVRVQLMTIHRAKGLEFDTVILPALDRGTGSGDSLLLTHEELSEAEAGGEAGILLAPLVEGTAPRDARRLDKLVKDRRKRAERAELYRLLYVACTRAVRELYLFGTVIANKKGAEPAKGSLLRVLWPALKESVVIGQDPVGEAVGIAGVRAATSDGSHAPHRAEPAMPIVPRLQRLAPGARPPSPPLWAWPESGAARRAAVNDATEDEIAFDWAGVTARHVGTVVHRQLQSVSLRVDELTAVLQDPSRLVLRRPRIERQLRQLGVPEAEREAAADRVLRALAQTFELEQGRWLFAPTHSEVRTEWALAAVHEGRLARSIIDRSFVDEQGVRWIIDFKTGEHRGGAVDTFLDREVDRYRDQLARYADIIGRIENRPLRLGLWYPLVPGFREVVLEC